MTSINNVSNQVITAIMANINFNPNSSTITLSGAWLWSTIDEASIWRLVQDMQPTADLIIDGLTITKFDTFGQFFIDKLMRNLKLNGHNNLTLKLSPAHQDILTHIVNTRQDKINNSPLAQQHHATTINGIIKNVLRSIKLRVEFIGQTVMGALQLLRAPHTFNLQEAMRTLKNAGFDSIFVVLLLNFLIATTLAYEMSPQFVRYGANVYIVNFLGIAMLKEVSPLLTAIIIAGRTGSAITAEIGTMKIQEELDALKAMGISPLQKLVLPKIIAVVIATPLLTALADVIGMVGGAIIANNYLNVSYTMFIERMQTYVSIHNYTAGIIKSIAFGLSIALIGCLQGLLVQGNANSVGERTTKSVVESIITIICLDAIFAVIFYRLGM